MTLLNTSLTNRLLGYPDDARLLIINADDFGMCKAINEAIVQTLIKGMVNSTTLMVPCPWALHAMRYLANHPDIAFGIHLTVISDWVNYRWGPITPREKVPTLIDKSGYFYNFDNMPEFLARVKMDQLELEFRAQIEAVLKAGLNPTHLDWHSLRIGNRTDIFELMVKLAKDYGLALRVAGKSSIDKLQSQGLPTSNYDFLDSYRIDPGNKPAHFVKLLHELPIGLSEWAVHPGLNNSELRDIEPDSYMVRQTDYDFFMSQEAKDIVKEEDIILLDYRILQEIWRKK
jgi:predicted glycoside hydrolase/deacetylase ChbG (UPF0249 family)